MKTIVVSLAGNPNVGKTTLLNHLAGSNLKVGNWAGVTIEKKEATAEFGRYSIHFVDLPGIYTLEPLSEAETVATGFLATGEVDVILNVIDTSNFTRNLYLTTELLEFGKPVVLALNMMDEATKRGMSVDGSRLSEMLGAGVVETNGRTGEGVSELLAKIVEAYESGAVPTEPVYSDEIEKELMELRESPRADWVSRHSALESLLVARDMAEPRARLERYFNKDLDDLLKDERWGFAHGLGKRIVLKRKDGARALTEKLDVFLLHPYLGILIYISLIYIVFKFSFDFSAPYMDWIDGFLNGYLGPLANLGLAQIGAPGWAMRFVSEAIIAGVGFVLTFVPLVACIYFFITVLEMSGYLPRIAFLMDRFMHKLGLHGNMITPLLLGFGCNVPAIMATKNMRSKTDRVLVIMMIPFMSCPARLVVFAFFAITFFDSPALVITSLYGIGIVVAVLTALVLKRSLFRGRTESFVLELPPYRMPSLRTVMVIVVAHVKAFLTRAGITIFVVSLVVWLMLNLPVGSAGTDRSIAAMVGKTLTPVFEPIGLSDWRAPSSLIPGFLAREIVLSTMAIIYSSTEGEVQGDAAGQAEEPFSPTAGLRDQASALGASVVDSLKSLGALVPGAFDISSAGGSNTLRSKIKESFTPLSAYSFMLLLLVYNSCVATVTVMIREVGRKLALGFLVYSFAAAWLLAFISYQLGSLFT